MLFIDHASGYDMTVNIDCVGNDLSRHDVTSAQECASICDQIPGCIAFVMDRRNIQLNKCYPKHTCAQTKYLQGVFLYKKGRK